MAKVRGSFGKGGSVSRKTGAKLGFPKPGFTGGGARGILRGGPVGSILRGGVGPERPSLFGRARRAGGRGCLGCTLPMLLMGVAALAGVIVSFSL